MVAKGMAFAFWEEGPAMPLSSSYPADAPINSRTTLQER